MKGSAHQNGHQNGAAAQDGIAFIDSTNQLLPQQPFASSVSKHKMGLLGAVSYVIGSMIGSGILITAKSVLAMSGSTGLCLLIWTAAGLISTLGGLVYTELGTSIHQNGADYAYLCYVGWRSAAFLCLWLNVWIFEPGGLAILAKTFAIYVVEALPFCNVLASVETFKIWQTDLIAVLVVTLFGWLNMYRVDKVGAGLQIASAGTKLIMLGGIILTGAYYLFAKDSTRNFQHAWADSTTSAGDVILAIYACQWSYSGWETLNYGMEEVENPKRNAPIAILLGTLLVAATYVFANVAYIAVLGKDAMLKTDAIGQTFVEMAFGPNFAVIVPVVIGLVLFGTLNPTLFCSSRVYFTGGREGQLPSFLATLHVTHKTPRAALLTTTLLSVIMILVGGNIEWLIDCITPVMFMQKTLSVAALIWIKWRNIPVDADAVRFPLAFHVLFLLICIGLVIIPIYQAPVTSAIGFGCVASGIPVYLILIRLKEKPKKLQQWDVASTVFVQKLLLSELDVKPESSSPSDAFDASEPNGLHSDANAPEVNRRFVANDSVTRF